MTQRLKPYWISWEYDDKCFFELDRPWWVSGYAPDARGAHSKVVVCAAVMATSERDAKTMVVKSYPNGPSGLRWRFVEEQSSDWSPFCDRFPRSAWMQWPGVRSPSVEAPPTNIVCDPCTVGNHAGCLSGVMPTGCSCAACEDNIDGWFV